MSKDDYIEDSYLRNFPQIQFLKELLIGHPGIIAGGCFKSIFTGQKPHDVDMFFRDSVDLHQAILYFKERPDEYTRGYENKNVESFIHSKSGIRIECVKKIFGSPEEILDQFDFTISKFAYEITAEPPDDPDGSWTYTDRIIYHYQFFEHLLMKRLVVDAAMPYPVSTFQRTYKYARSGFFPCHETKLKILRAVSQLAFVEEDMLSKSLYGGHD